MVSISFRQKMFGEKSISPIDNPPRASKIGGGDILTQVPDAAEEKNKDNGNQRTHAPSSAPSARFISESLGIAVIHATNCQPGIKSKHKKSSESRSNGWDYRFVVFQSSAMGVPGKECHQGAPKNAPSAALIPHKVSTHGCNKGQFDFSPSRQTAIDLCKRGFWSSTATSCNREQ